MSLNANAIGLEMHVDMLALQAQRDFESRSLIIIIRLFSWLFELYMCKYLLYGVTILCLGTVAYKFPYQVAPEHLVYVCADQKEMKEGKKVFHPIIISEVFLGQLSIGLYLKRLLEMNRLQASCYAS